MRKHTKAYKLKAMKAPVFAFQYNDKWYPSSEGSLFEKEIFIRGHGWIKILQKMRKGAIKYIYYLKIGRHRILKKGLMSTD